MISVVIPCFRSAPTILRSLNSIFAQSLLPKEIILVDDGNGDSFYDQLRSGGRKNPGIPIEVVKNSENLGPAGSRNQGWEKAKFEYIAFLDHDDAWHPRKLEWQLERFQRNPNLSLVSHRSVCVEECHQMNDWREKWQDEEITPFRLSVSNFFSTPTVMLRRDLPLRFDDSLRYAEDYDLWLRIIFSGFSGTFMNVPLTFLFKPRYGAGGLSGNLWKMEKGVQRVFRKLYRQGLISKPGGMFLRFFSGLKFVRRCFLSQLNITPI